MTDVTGTGAISKSATGYCMTNNSHDYLNWKLMHPSKRKTSDCAINLAYTLFHQAGDHGRMTTAWVSGEASR
jgi:hypothetical protein